MVLKCIWIIELNWMGKSGKKMQKSPHSGHFLGSSLGTRNALFSVSTNFRILTITCSFLLRFELLKLLVKINCKENHTYRNRHRQILIISGLNIHSK